MKNTVKVERAIKNITQAQLAKMIGVSRQTINAIEKGNYSPSILLALKMAHIFEKGVSEVFSLEESDWEK